MMGETQLQFGVFQTLPQEFQPAAVGHEASFGKKEKPAGLSAL
jgi:hypothetical protein